MFFRKIMIKIIFLNYFNVFILFLFQQHKLIRLIYILFISIIMFRVDFRYIHKYHQQFLRS